MIFFFGDTARDHLFLSYTFSLSFQFSRTMDDATKLALFDALFIYLLKSSYAMTTTRKALASNPLFTSQTELLTATLDSAKLLLSKVSSIYIYFDDLNVRLRLPNIAKKRLTRASWKQRRIVG